MNLERIDAEYAAIAAVRYFLKASDCGSAQGKVQIKAIQGVRSIDKQLGLRFIRNGAE